MQDQDQDSKTESPTPRRQEEFRKRGEVVFSREVMAVSGIAAAVLGLILTGELAYEEMATLWQTIGDRIAYRQGAVDVDLFHIIMSGFVKILALPASISVVAILLTGVSQTKFNISWTPLEPKFDKLNPLPKLKKMFMSLQTVVEMLKSIAKLTVLGAIAWMILSNEVTWLARIPHVSLEASLVQLSDLALRLLFALGIALTILAAIDYGWQWYQMNQKMRMTKQEIKDEVKQNEGDPLIAGQRRARQRQMARERSQVAKAAEATVIVVNPTHVAVALRYEPGIDAAPMVLCKGMDLVAAEIRSIARKNNVPIIQRRQLARMLYKTSKPGKAIPLDLYEAVAEVLAIMMRQKRARKR